MLNTELLIRLFRAGKLGIKSAEFLHQQGYAVVCGNGGVLAVIKEANDETLN